MADSPIGRVVDHLRITLALPDEAALSDAHLLARFIDTRDEGAFAALARRYGPLVMGVCRRVTRHREDAEDAFQATFHVLVRKAAAIKSRKLLANWLYGVAHKTALKARAMAAKRRSRETQVKAMPEPAAMEQEHSQHDLLPLLDQELSRLPDKYRIPIVLCDLQGLSHKEAARGLGIAENSVSSRISRARQMLAKRLARHGPVVSSAGLAGMLAPNSAAARVPLGLLAKTVKGAVLVASGRTASGLIPAQVAAIAEGVVKAMLLTKLKTFTLCAVLVAVLGVGVGKCSIYAFGEVQGDAQNKVGQKPSDVPKKENQSESVSERDRLQTDKLKANHTVKVPSLLDGTIQFIGTEIKAGENVPPESVVEVSIGGEKKRFRRLKKGDPVVEGQLLARLDDRLAQEEVRIQKVKVIGAQAELGGAKAIAGEAEFKLQTSTRLFGARALPMEELRSAVLTRDKMTFDLMAKENAAKLAELELQKAQTIIELHEIRSYVRGSISSIKKHPGEAVKKFETILEIEIKEKKE